MSRVQRKISRHQRCHRCHHKRLDHAGWNGRHREFGSACNRCTDCLRFIFGRDEMAEEVFREMGVWDEEQSEQQSGEDEFEDWTNKELLAYAANMLEW